MDSEFSDEYQDWLEGSTKSRTRRRLFDRTLKDVEEPRQVFTTRRTSVRALVEKMSAEHVGCALVVEEETLLGIFSERDLLTRVVARGLDPDRTRVEDVMTRNPETLPHTAMLAHALRTMVLGELRHLPIVDAAGRPHGTVSLRRLAQFVSEAFPGETMNVLPCTQRFALRAEGG